ncbi:SufE family protein [Rarobacter faecitabidus]|uniref:Cysteine desulfuration protein SufE n=1 Tax=Rarobacter faecitabidus TaxID=13243 RepID=A0A542ZV10_RARFA|nr:SufE family protein [Rarobacter faecitabidus]TQL64020.1 cysteine desulfuration protein SufE [Rarobacter faecitabidus]
MTTAPADKALPEVLASIREDFLALPERERLQLLLEFSRELPSLPAKYQSAPGLLERVEECQSPVRAFAELDDEAKVHLYATAPEEAPTTRGFASILVQGISGLTADEVLNIPDDYPAWIGLDNAVSPLRLRGMAGILSRTKRQVREQLAARSS